MHEYKARITRVIDGDTFEATVDLGFNVWIDATFRVLNLDTPETHRPSCKAEKIHGERAKARAKELLEGKELVIRTFKGDETGKYGRYLASVALEDGRDYASVMEAEGLVKLFSYPEEL